MPAPLKVFGPESMLFPLALNPVLADPLGVRLVKGECYFVRVLPKELGSPGIIGFVPCRVYISVSIMDSICPISFIWSKFFIKEGTFSSPFSYSSIISFMFYFTVSRWYISFNNKHVSFISVVTPSPAFYIISKNCFIWCKKYHRALWSVKSIWLFLTS